MNDKAKLRPDDNPFMFYLYEKWQLNNKSALVLSNFVTVWAADSISYMIHVNSNIQ